jgi:hypothetical protein
MGKIYVPVNEPEDWKALQPDKHWRTGYSAKTLAYCWQEASGFPRCVKRVFRSSGISLFRNLKLLLAFPEYKVSLPPRGGRPSQNDIFVLAKGNSQLVSIAVEGKVEEPFGDYVPDWKLQEGKGKDARIKFLCNKLQIDENKIDHIRYQLIHRTASAIIEAEKFNTENALMLVHSFCRTDKWEEGFEDYKKFLGLYRIQDVVPDSIVYAGDINGIDLYFGWVRGEEEYLDK